MSTYSKDLNLDAFLFYCTHWSDPWTHGPFSKELGRLADETVLSVHHLDRFHHSCPRVIIFYEIVSLPIQDCPSNSSWAVTTSRPHPARPPHRLLGLLHVVRPICLAACLGCLTFFFIVALMSQAVAITEHFFLYSSDFLMVSNDHLGQWSWYHISVVIRMSPISIFLILCVAAPEGSVLLQSPGIQSCNCHSVMKLQCH
jgi:hypothetical protein